MRPAQQPDRLRELEAGRSAERMVGAGRGRRRAAGLRHARSASTTARPSTSRSASVATWHFDMLRLGWYGGERRPPHRVGPHAAAPRSRRHNRPASPTPTPASSTAGTGACRRAGRFRPMPSPASTSRCLTRDDTGGQSHIVFVVRDDSSHSTMVVQTSDTTWEAYNPFGGFSLYQGSNAAHRAYKVSYNRPFITVQNDSRNWFTNAELPMWQYLERNGYDVSYISGVDTDRSGALLMNHQIFVSSGHDEYWSGRAAHECRSRARRGREPRVLLAATRCTGRRATSRAPTGRNTAVPHAGHVQGVVRQRGDRPGRADVDRAVARHAVQPARRRRPARELRARARSARVICCQDTMQVAAADSEDAALAQHRDRRDWRRARRTRSRTARSATSSTPTSTTASNPPGLIRASTTTTSPSRRSSRTSRRRPAPATVTHHLTEYRAPSGALVFDAGTINWSFTLHGQHTTGDPADPNAQQATVNVFADMGVAARDARRHPRARDASTDTTAPTSTITTPLAEHGRRARHDRHGLAAPRPTPAAASSAASRSRPTAAPRGTRRPGVRSGPTRGRPPATARSRSRPAPSTTAATSRRPSAGVHVTVNCPCTPVLDPTADDAGRERRSRRVEVGIRFHADDRRLHLRRPLLQGHDEHRRAHRQPLDHERHAARDRDVHERDGDRVGSRSTSPPRSRSPRTPTTSSRTTPTRAATRSTRRYFYTQRRRRAAPRPPRARPRRRQRCLLVRHRERASRRRRNGRANYWVDVVFATDADPADASSRPTPADGADRPSRRAPR